MDVAVGDRVALVVDERDVKSVSVLTVTEVTSRLIVTGNAAFYRGSGRQVRYASRRLSAPVMNRYIAELNSPIVLRILAMQVLNNTIRAICDQRVVRPVSVIEVSRRLAAVEAGVVEARRVVDELVGRYYR